MLVARLPKCKGVPSPKALATGDQCFSLVSPIKPRRSQGNEQCKQIITKHVYNFEN